MAIGNPFGLGGTVTVGIISAKKRDINAGPYDEFLQTDAAINRGNSGGPLFNMQGEVIGVNTAIISPTGGSIGIGFAVPSNTATHIIEQLRKFGETRRGWLGVRIQTVTDTIAESLGMDEPEGALVASVTPDSPAADAGVEPGDVILKFDGQDIDSMRSLPRIVARTPIDKAVKVEILRGDKKMTLTVDIGRMPEQPVAASAKEDDKSDKKPEPKTKSLLGLSISKMTDELRSRFKIDSKVKGVVIIAVDPEGAAAEKNIQAGDVIVEVTRTEVSEPDEVDKEVEGVKKSGRKSVLLLIANAKGELRFVAVPVGDG
jgi:serine protease Do